jgi:hypothetical protein
LGADVGSEEEAIPTKKKMQLTTVASPSDKLRDAIEEREM